jgi:hypothetical protein
MSGGSPDTTFVSPDPQINRQITALTNLTFPAKTIAPTNRCAMEQISLPLLTNLIPSDSFS